MPSVERTLTQLLRNLEREVLVGQEHGGWGEGTNGGLRLGCVWESKKVMPRILLQQEHLWSLP